MISQERNDPVESATERKPGPDKVLGETSGEQVEPNNDNLDKVK
jgi:hypothetical protein